MLPLPYLRPLDRLDVLFRFAVAIDSPGLRLARLSGAAIGKNRPSQAVE